MNTQRLPPSVPRRADGERPERSQVPELPGVEEVGLLPIFTLVLWLCCVAVGLIGLRASRDRPPPATTQAAFPPVEAIDVDITSSPLPPEASNQPAPSQKTDQPLPAEDLPIPSVPPLPAVAAPSPEIAFAQPIEGPTRIVPAKVASPAPIPMAPHPPVQQLTFGEGEGRQPAPIYPREAEIARQEGDVGIRFNVDQDGNVVDVEAFSPSRWPLLNQASVRAVRETWRFQTGPPRSYEITFSFRSKQ